MAIGSDRALPSAPDRFLVLTLRLRDRRRALGLTQQQVVRRLATFGVSTTNKALSSLEHGAGIDAAKLPEFAAALDCTVTYLLGLTADPHSWQPEASLGPRSAAPDNGNPLPRQDLGVRQVQTPPTQRPDPRWPGSDDQPVATKSWILGPYPAGDLTRPEEPPPS